jgi:hypothetical protein
MPWTDDGRVATVTLLALAAAALYVASRWAAGALAAPERIGKGAGDGAGRRAVGHWLPIAATAFVAAARGKPEIAVSVTFGTSVACLSLVLGALNFLAPMGTPPAARRVWPFVLPAALLLLIAGFSGHLTWVHAMALLLLGCALAPAWRDPSLRDVSNGPVAALPATPLASGDEAGVNPPPRWARGVEILLCVALAVIGGWTAVAAAARAEAVTYVVAPGLFSVLILSPLLTLPLLNPATPEQAARTTPAQVSTLVAITLLNLCLLLPAVTLYWYLKTGFAGLPQLNDKYFTSALAALREHAKPLPYPLTAWRIDSVVLTVLGFAFVPVALGRWAIGKWEAAALVLGYLLYLVVTAAATFRV